MVRTRSLPGAIILALCLLQGLSWAQVSFVPRVKERSLEEQGLRASYSVCPPFFLRDEAGRVIDPLHGRNVHRPYSPEKTCGACHDYRRITSAYHFQQGRGERVPEWQAARYPWVSSPGQYGGRW